MYRKWVKISLILVYLVIVAGAMVRMTGSGMGCPDWPKCFGYYIPPTELSEIEWESNREYKKGQVIILDESLKVASDDFITADTFNPQNWNDYTKHNYAVFNVWHTWIEYVNRLIGAIAGLAVLIMALISIRKWKEDKILVLITWLTVFAIAFQGWLGATVVYSVLAPIKITIHMLMALLIVALLLYLLFRSNNKKIEYALSRSFISLIILSLILTVIQVVLGTQVRQFVDEQITRVGYEAEELWLAEPDLNFYVHRTFSLVIFFLNAGLWFFNRKFKLGIKNLNWIFGLIMLEVISGIAMYYFDFPILSQPLHLVIASVLFGFQLYVILEIWPRTANRFSAKP